MSASLNASLRQAAKRVWYFGTKFDCPICQSTTRMRHTYSYDFPVLRDLDVVGGEYAPADDCPICFANQRTRLIFGVLAASALLQPGFRVLHVAPERALYDHLFAPSGCAYQAIDLDPGRYDYISGILGADITALPFEPADFDLVVCNHVLEHVPDDSLAMRELRRVLAPNGLAILQVPLAQRLERTIEDPSVEDPRERERRFGQWDHVRIYNEADYRSRLQSAGFATRAFTVDELLSARDAKRLEVNRRERLIVAGSQASLDDFAQRLIA